MLGLLDRDHRIVAEPDIDQHVGAAIGDVEQVGAEIRCAERRELVRDRLPAGLLGHLLHRVEHAVAVGVVGGQIGGLAVRAERLDQHRPDRMRGCVGVEAGAEGVAHAILAGRVVRAGNARQIEHVLALGIVVAGDRGRAAHRAGRHHRLVVADEARLRLHRLVGIGLLVRDAEFHLLAEHALRDLGRHLVHQVAAGIEMLDRELVAFPLVVAGGGIGAGERHGDADEHRITLASRRPGADRRLVRRHRCPRRGGQQAGADGGGRAGAEQVAPRYAARARHAGIGRHVLSPWARPTCPWPSRVRSEIGFIGPSTRTFSNMDFRPALAGAGRA